MRQLDAPANKVPSVQTAGTFVAASAAEADLDRKTGMSAEKRTERARKGAEALHTVSNYVRRIRRKAADLTPEDLEALRAIVGPVSQPDIYAEGVRAGARMALDRIVRLAKEAG